jgi:hypothetical protein
VKSRVAKTELSVKAHLSSCEIDVPFNIALYFSLVVTWQSN